MSSVMLFMCVCLRPYVLSASSDCHQRSSYKDCNTLHLPMERFSPVRRFSDGAATIQAFKAHLENNSLIKKLKQVCHYFLWKNMLKDLVKKMTIADFAALMYFHFFCLLTHSKSGCRCGMKPFYQVKNNICHEQIISCDTFKE